MAVVVTTLPQDVVAIPSVTIRDFVQVLPNILPWPINVWIGGKLAKYGKGYGNQIFLVEMDTEPPVELCRYFTPFVKCLGISATVSHHWREAAVMVRLYNEGVLIVDKKTLAYTELPTTIASPPELTSEYLLANLPKTIPFDETLWLCGGVARHGVSFKDADFLVGSTPEFVDPVEKSRMAAIRRHLSAAIGWSVDVGCRLMPWTEPIWVYKTYEGGTLCLP